MISEKEELVGFPYWIGTIEKIEQGERFIYETIENKEHDGKTTITYIKKDDRHNILKKYIFLIDGDRVQAL
jgi:bla regulator protein BlaR1